MNLQIQAEPANSGKAHKPRPSASPGSKARAGAAARGLWNPLTLRCRGQFVLPRGFSLPKRGMPGGTPGRGMQGVPGRFRGTRVAHLAPEDSN